MAEDDLCYMSATEALARFTDKSLSPVELMQAIIDRAGVVEGQVNALTYTHFEEALVLAREAEARYMRAAPAGPLDGLALAVKDEGAIKDKPLSNGSLLLAGTIPDYNSPVNQRLLDSGAIVHARTATPEFSCAGYTWSRLWGVTRNPWNLEFTPGGSSGGAGAALAAGSCTLASGSDIGGSIRIPASASGVVGLKPAYGRVPEEPPFNLDIFCHQGPMARSVGDAALMFSVMAGPHPLDIATQRDTPVLPRVPGSIRGMKIAWSPDLGIFRIEPEVRRNTEAALDVLRDLGAVVEEVDLGWQVEWLEDGLDYLKLLMGNVLRDMASGREEELTSYARALIEGAGKVPASALMRCYQSAGKMYATLGPVLERFDALICPTNGLPAVPAEYDQSRDVPMVDGAPVHPLYGWKLTLPFNMLSRCPVLAVPTGHATNRVPTGMQIVGRPWAEADVFRIGLAYEKAVGGWYDRAEKRPVMAQI
ncbi:MAG: amidase [Pararhodobacter sp.]|nr:amidase [Pararhodobacter sp.]